MEVEEAEVDAVDLGFPSMECTLSTLHMHHQLLLWSLLEWQCQL